MFGCPEGYIYNSRDTIQQMEKDGKISYRGDTIVRRLLEENGRVKIEAVQRKTGEPLHFDASRVFLAAGAIPSTRILIESLDLFGRTLRMKDSQYFLLPFLRFAGACGVQAESANTLCQLFIEMASDTVISKGVHLQIYGYNEFVGQAIRSSLGPIGRLLPRFSRELEERTLVFQGYLHSDLSGAIDITVDRPDAAGLSPMRLKSRFNPETKKTIRTVIKKLCSQALPLRGVPLFPMLQVAPPGRGFHTGGTFPMSCNPGPLESDTLGRPYGFTKVHVVDSTVLPSLPATTITFSVMANAHRIASLASRLPQR